MWSIDLGVEATYIPRLSASQRSAGFDKPEATNLSPVLPRPRLAIVLPGDLRIEGSWLPPVTVFDAKANVLSIAASRGFSLRHSFIVAPRVAFQKGRVTAAITCGADLASGTQDEQVYWARVCHGRKSQDRFDPESYSAELIAARTSPLARLLPYAGVGVERERTRFDIGVMNDDGSRDTDHPILELEATRPYLFAGASTGPWRATKVAAELYLMPGSLVTLRFQLFHHFDVSR